MRSVWRLSPRNMASGLPECAAAFEDLEKLADRLIVKQVVLGFDPEFGEDDREDRDVGQRGPSGDVLPRIRGQKRPRRHAENVLEGREEGSLRHPYGNSISHNGIQLPWIAKPSHAPP